MNVKWFWNQCSRLEQRLSLWAADRLPETERAKVEAHLSKCPACQARFRDLQAVAAQIRTLANALPTLESPASLRTRWREGVLREAGPKSESRLARTEPWSGWLSSWPVMRRMAWGAIVLCWLLTAFFRVSGPSISRPAIASGFVSWKEVRMALQQMERPTPSRPPPESGGDSERDLPSPSPRSELPAQSSHV
jgi:anti-sigma factor RsiW